MAASRVKFEGIPAGKAARFQPSEDTRHVFNLSQPLSGSGSGSSAVPSNRRFESSDVAAFQTQMQAKRAIGSKRPTAAIRTPRGRFDLLRTHSADDISSMIDEEKAHLGPGATDLDVKLRWQHRLQFIATAYELHIASLPFKKADGTTYRTKNGGEGKHKGYVVFKEDRQVPGKFIVDTRTFLGAASALVDPTVSADQFWDTLMNEAYDREDLQVRKTPMSGAEIKKYQHNGTYGNLKAEYDPISGNVTVFGQPTSETKTAARNFGLAAALHADEGVIEHAATLNGTDVRQYLTGAMQRLGIRGAAGMVNMSTYRANKLKIKAQALKDQRDSEKLRRGTQQQQFATDARAARTEGRELRNREASQAEQARLEALEQDAIDATARAVAARGETGGRYYSYMDYPY